MALRGRLPSAARAVALLITCVWLPRDGNAQKGIGSLNDPCDCMQHHDYWMATRSSLTIILEAENFAERIFDEKDPLHTWVKVQSCMYSPENEEAHRPTALSDCIPGFLFTHVICMQRHIVHGNVVKAMSYASELARLFPWGVNCMDNSGWPMKSWDVMRYYRRVRRTFAKGPDPDGTWPMHLLKEMAWISPNEAWRRHPEERWHREDETPQWSLASKEEATMSEEAEVCPVGSIPEFGACWVLGKPGANCRDACKDAGLEFRKWRRQPEEAYLQPMTPYLLSFWDRLPARLMKQHEWVAFECYVEGKDDGEDRFHMADPLAPMDEQWSYPICSLTCPCGPKLPLVLQLVLGDIPILPQDI